MNLIILCSFCITNLSFNTYIRVVTYITYFFLLNKLHIHLLHLSIFTISGKNSTSLCSSRRYLRYITSTSRIYPQSVASSLNFMKSSSNSDVFSAHSKLSTGNFCDTACPYRFFMSQYMRKLILYLCRNL